MVLETYLENLSTDFKKLPYSIQSKIKLRNLDNCFMSLLKQQGYSDVEELFYRDFVFKRYNSNPFDTLFLLTHKYWQMRDSVNSAVDYSDNLDFDFLTYKSMAVTSILTNLIITTNFKYGLILDVSNYSLDNLSRVDVHSMAKDLRGEIHEYINNKKGNVL